MCILLLNNHDDARRGMLFSVVALAYMCMSPLLYFYQWWYIMLDDGRYSRIVSSY